MPIDARTVDQVSLFSGDPVQSFVKRYFDTAAKQAKVLFREGTCLVDLPTDPDDRELVEMALDEMTYQIYLERHNRKLLAQPFSSETIGSYSYTKLSQAIRDGKSTGLEFFDLARDRLAICGDQGGFAGGSIHAMENDAPLLHESDEYSELLGPADLNRELPYFFRSGMRG